MGSVSLSQSAIGKPNSETRNENHSTGLSKYVWNFKDKMIDHTIKWSIIQFAPTYSPETGKCQLCNLEKTLILIANEPNLLNQRNEMMNKCRHRRDHLLSSLKSK